MKQHVVAAALACWIGGAVAASTSPSAVVDAFVRAGKTDADLAVVDRNLAVTLRESGQWQAAKILLLSVPGSQTRYASDLATKCLDRDTGLYQALSEF